MTADTILNLDDDTCDLDGYGPITADQARRLALTSATTMLKRVICNPDQSVCYLDTNTYRLPTNQTSPSSVPPARSVSPSVSALRVLSRVFTDPPDDSILTYDPGSYRFHTHQGEAIRALHPISVFPGSVVPARHCDLDHRTPYTHTPPGPDRRTGPDPPGQTVVTNAQPLHRKGHRLKTHAGWHVETIPNDPHTLIWTSPHQRTYTVNDHHGA